MEVLLVILGIIVVLAFLIIGIYNRLVALRQTTRSKDMRRMKKPPSRKL